MDANQVIGLIISIFLIFGIPGLIIYWIGKKIYSKIQLSRLKRQEASEKETIRQFKQELATLYKNKQYQEIIDRTGNYTIRDLDDARIIASSFLYLDRNKEGFHIINKTASQISYSPYNREKYSLAIVLYGHKLYRETIQILQDIDPFDLKEAFKEGHYEVPLLMGDCYFELGKYEAALESFKKAPINSANIRGELNEIIAYAGRCYEELGNTKMAIKYYNKALSNDISLVELEEKIIELEGKEV